MIEPRRQKNGIILPVFVMPPNAYPGMQAHSLRAEGATGDSMTKSTANRIVNTTASVSLLACACIGIGTILSKPAQHIINIATNRPVTPPPDWIVKNYPEWPELDMLVLLCTRWDKKPGADTETQWDCTTQEYKLPKDEAKQREVY